VKDQFTLLRAAALLRNAGFRFRLDVVGVDTLHGSVQRHAQLLRLGSAVNFHGALRREQVRAFMDEADVLLVSSRHEAGPLVVLEAAVAGVPTVGTCVGHVAEWAGEAAVGVPVGDAEALARETVALLGDDARRLSLAREAQWRAVAEDADETARRFERIYEEIAGMRRSVARWARE
jgi:glycosyltransferase involved in cell wall biosynthesis